MIYEVKALNLGHHNAASHGCRAALCLMFLMVEAASGQATSGAIVIKTSAEVQVQAKENGRLLPKLKPADRLVKGDQVIYTLEVRNASRGSEPPPTVTHPVPDHMSYIAASAIGPGAEVSYSVDGGKSFERADALTVVGADGRPHLASASDYTHIRWQLKNALQPGSVAFLRFRAVVK